MAQFIHIMAFSDMTYCSLIFGYRISGEHSAAVFMVNEEECNINTVKSRLSGCRFFEVPFSPR